MEKYPTSYRLKVYGEYSKSAGKVTIIECQQNIIGDGDFVTKIIAQSDELLEGRCLKYTKMHIFCEDFSLPKS